MSTGPQHETDPTAADPRASLTPGADRPTVPGRAGKAQTPGQTLNRLIATIVRGTGLSHAEINRRLNRKLGVTTRVGASQELLDRGIALAEQYVEMLARSPGQKHGPGSAQEHGPEPAQKHGPGSARAAAAADGSVSVRRPRTAGRSLGPPPTNEQQRAIDAMRDDEHFVLQAGAGTGKTTTLAMLARSDSRRGMFLAFNRSVVTDAERKFPAHVQCRTGHSLAMRAIGSHYGERLGQPREPSWKAGQRLGIARNMSLRLGTRQITHKTLSYVTLETLNRFCYSADTEIRARHVPRLRGLAEEYREDLARLVLPYARRAWADVQDSAGRLVRFNPNHALKIWALKEPVIRADFLLLDEAQDTNPVMEEVFNAQRSHAQLIMVGDSAQAIYGWRGARDVMTDFEGRQLTLSQSFRFGPVLAEEANRWLTIVESPLRLRGTPTIETRIGPLERADAILCRTNSGAISEVFQLLEERRRVALVGGAAPLRELARAAGDLKAGRRTSHPELVLFQSWLELQEYALDDPAGQDLLPLVDIIDEHGVDKVLDAVGKLHAEGDAEVTLSTAHKAKGREWATVRISTDFDPPLSKERDLEGNPLPGELSLDDARLAYVAVTRARQQLDLGGLAWINDHPDGRPDHTLPTHTRPQTYTHTPTPTTAADTPSRGHLGAPPRLPAPSAWDRLGPAPS
ncbi:UvrD-helicase domain-containing protein [Streptomyces sp. NBC_00690]|uniref:UvrD-helicase domain-containing protein n=1 Tax=Streptomyces sp. NBC_00690 TaxID=2975808 RepID=UPI002E2C8DA8|nr:UvrD-helicase domain-containing protein [Streptomyces sp. NBC_00690]